MYFTNDFTTPVNSAYQSYLFEMKAVSSTTDVVFATIGSEFQLLKIGRLQVSRSTHSVTNAMVYSESSAWTGIRAHAMFIVDVNQISLLAIHMSELYLISHNYLLMESRVKQVLNPLQ